MPRRYELCWRGEFGNRELNELHAQAFRHPVLQIDWLEQLHAHSLGWVIARRGCALAGFVNVAWDGDAHAFLLDTMVSAAEARQGLGAQLVAAARDAARAAGCEWLHVDFEGEALRAFYFERCGFRPTSAGLIALGRRGSSG
jgi:GNAT superfamily N-acetyltransferase